MSSIRKKNLVGKVIGYIFLITISYLCFFAPVFNIPRVLSSYVILTIVNILLFFLHFKHYIKLIRRYSKILLLVLVLSAIVFFRTAMGGDSTYIREHYLFFLMDFFTPLTLCVIASNFKLEEEDSFVRVIMITASIAAAISCICLVNPNIHQFVKYELQYIDEENKAFDYVYRCYGLTNGYLFSYGIALGVIVGICFQFIEKYKYFWISVPFIFIAILVNARTGALIGIASLLVYLYTKKSISVVGTFFMGGVAVLLIFYFFGGYLLSNDDATGFMLNFFLQMDASSGKGNTLNELNEMIRVLPGDLEGWLLGYGRNVMYGVEGMHSDTGFSHDLFYGGLLYTIPKYWIVFIPLHKLRKIGYKNVGTVLLFAFVIANVKGPYVATEAFSISVLSYFWLSNYNRKIRYGKYKETVIVNSHRNL